MEIDEKPSTSAASAPPATKDFGSAGFDDRLPVDPCSATFPFYPRHPGPSPVYASPPTCRIIGRVAKRGRLMYQLLYPGARYSVVESPCNVPIPTIAQFEYEFSQRGPSMFPPCYGLATITDPLDVCWMGWFDSQAYGLLRYNNQVHRLAPWSWVYLRFPDLTRQFLERSPNYSSPYGGATSSHPRSQYNQAMITQNPYRAGEQPHESQQSTASFLERLLLSLDNPSSGSRSRMNVFPVAEHQHVASTNNGDDEIPPDPFCLTPSFPNHSYSSYRRSCVRRSVNTTTLLTRKNRKLSTTEEPEWPDDDMAEPEMKRRRE